ncbi:MFS general substrate transporter [Cadophora sp. DSE1049]|nr:MFS general substrate transporter [Cadophora sp. DSE1049]
MGLGVLDAKSVEQILGTSLLDEDANSGIPDRLRATLKTAKGKNGNIVLIPQPSNDVNDPLNWPEWKKQLTFAVLCFGTALVCVPGPMLGSSFGILNVEFNASFTKLAQLNGIVIVMAAPSIWIASAIIPYFGKRPVFLVSMILMMVACIWAAKAKSYGSLLGARAIQGFAAGPFEAVVTGTIADLFFVHQRGKYSAAWVMCQLGPTNLAPLVCAYIATNLGWRWAFWILAIFSGVCTILLFLFCPETHYKHDANIETMIAEDDTEKEAPAMHAEQVENGGGVAMHGSRRTFVQELSLFPTHRLSKDNMVKSLSRPLALLSYPAILYGSFCYAMTVNWAVILNISLVQVLSGPPYLFDGIQVGLVYLSAFAWVLITSCLAGPLSDFLAKKLSRKNNGIYEPEFRLWVVILYLFFGTMGFVGFGLSVAAGDHWFGFTMFMGMINGASIFGNVTFIAYVVDSHPFVASESLITLNIVKSVIVYAFTWFINDWIAARGVKETFSILGGLNTVIALLAIPMYIFGKRGREWIQTSPALNALQYYTGETL